MDVESLCQRENTLQATITLCKKLFRKPFATYTSPEYIISGAAVFQVRISVTMKETRSFVDNIQNTLVFIKFFKLHLDDDLTYTIKLTSMELKIVNKNFISDDGTWHLIYESDINTSTRFEVTVHMDTVASATSFATLHEDTELTDFELRGEDGSVFVHRAVLAAASPVLRRMLAGWREAAEGRVYVPGTSKVTLQNLKDYFYVQTLPDKGLEQLLLLASYYMIEDLEQKCAYKLVSSLSAGNALALLEFATKHKMTRLLMSILECIKNGTLELDEMRFHLHVSKCIDKVLRETLLD